MTDTLARTARGQAAASPAIRRRPRGATPWWAPSPAAPGPAAPKPGTPLRWAPAAVAGVMVAAAVLGFLLSHDAASAAALRETDPGLVRLLRGMAVLKAVLAAGVGALVVWRLRHPAGPRLAALYVLAGALVAAAPGVVWTLGHLIAGAALFHAGLLLLIALAWADRGAARGANRDPGRPAAVDQAGGGSV